MLERARSSIRRSSWNVIPCNPPVACGRSECRRSRHHLIFNFVAEPHLELTNGFTIFWSFPSLTRLDAWAHFSGIPHGVAGRAGGGYRTSRHPHDFGASLSTLQWTINAYALAYAASITTAAALGDRFGRRRLFAIGLALFAATSAACALAPSIQLLVAARVFQGIGAGIIMPLSLTILTTTFPGERRGAVVGIWGGIAGIAVASGPLIGGTIIQALTWHWIFWVNVPIGLIGALLAFGLLSESVGPPTRLDLVAVALVSGGAVGIVLGMVRASDLGWTDGHTLTTLIAGLVLMAGFVVWELRTSEPMLPMRLFRSAAFSAANATGFFMTGALFAAVFLVANTFNWPWAIRHWRLVSACCRGQARRSLSLRLPVRFQIGLDVDR